MRAIVNKHTCERVSAECARPSGLDCGVRPARRNDEVNVREQSLSWKVLLVLVCAVANRKVRLHQHETNAVARCNERAAEDAIAELVETNLHRAISPM